MNEQRYDSIDYDSDWQTVQTVTAAPVRMPQYRTDDDFTDDDDGEVYVTRSKTRGRDEDEEEYPYKEKTPKSGTQVLIKYQLIICILAAVAAFALKSFGGQIYEMVDNWYTTQISSSLVVEAGNFF